jgi:hypothetical protein
MRVRPSSSVTRGLEPSGFDTQGCLIKERICSGIASAGRMKSASPVEMALRGMPSNLAEVSSCTITMPPHSLTDRMPRIPSLPVPDRMTAMALRPWSSASERRNTSMGKFSPLEGSWSVSSSLPWKMVRFFLGGIR